MADRDDAAAAYYENPENRRVKGSGRKRAGQAPRLGSHVPVRFSATIIERVKELAAADRKTVSSWIRDVVEREILRRERSRTVGVASKVTWKGQDPSSTVTTGSGGTTEFDQIAV